MYSHRTDEYLEAIYKLEQQEHPVRIVNISTYLKLSPPSVLEMLKRLQKKRFLSIKKGIVCLTKKGNKEALKVIRKHRLSERFLTDVLGFNWENAHVEACKLEHAISDDVEEHLDKTLGLPQTCPHGHPIPDKHGKMRAGKNKKLNTLKSGEKATIKCVYENDIKMLQYLSNLGLLPDVKIKVEEIAPFGGPMMIKVGKSKYALGQTIASKIEVRKINK